MLDNWVFFDKTKQKSQEFVVLLKVVLPALSFSFFHNKLPPSFVILGFFPIIIFLCSIVITR